MEGREREAGPNVSHRGLTLALNVKRKLNVSLVSPVSCTAVYNLGRPRWRYTPPGMVAAGFVLG